MIHGKTTRRATLRAGAGVLAAGTLGAPIVHAQGAAGSLRCGFWDHWVPAGNDAMRQLCAEWGERNGARRSVDLLCDEDDADEGDQRRISDDANAKLCCPKVELASEARFRKDAAAMQGNQVKCQTADAFAANFISPSCRAPAS